MEPGFSPDHLLLDQLHSTKISSSLRLLTDPSLLPSKIVVIPTAVKRARVLISARVGRRDLVFQKAFQEERPRTPLLTLLSFELVPNLRLSAFISGKVLLSLKSPTSSGWGRASALQPDHLLLDQLHSTKISSSRTPLMRARFHQRSNRSEGPFVLS